MQLKGEHLAAQLQRELKPVYLVYGDEPLLVIEAADAIRAAARQARLRRTRSAGCRSAGFQLERSLPRRRQHVAVRRPQADRPALPTGKPGRDGGAALQAYCARPSPDALLLVTMTGADWREEKAAWVAPWLPPERSSN
jgi:DNA polymerase-3 subunit delta